MSSYHSGLTGEELASANLRGLGLRVMKTRYRADGGEIDIIARDGDVLVVAKPDRLACNTGDLLRTHLPRTT